MPQHFGTHTCVGDGTTISKVAGRSPFCAEAGLVAEANGPSDAREGESGRRRISHTNVSSEHATSSERYAQLTMTATLIARAGAAGRIIFGVALVVAPERLTSLWLGSDAGRPGARVVTRGLGARDVALGVGALAAADSQLQPWVAAAIVADTADLVATVAAGKSLPLTGRVLVGAVAAGGAVLGTIALASLRRSSPLA